MILAFEFFTIFTLLPLIFFFKILPLFLIMPLLWIVMFYAIYILKRENQKLFNRSFKLRPFKTIFIRFVVITLSLIALTYLFVPKRAFEFVLENPQIYVIVIVLYPILSVIAQEIIFRTFFFFRYEKFFGNSAIWVNALLFSYAHIVFQNWVAVVLTLFAGYMFAKTYEKQGLKTTITEHALYGDMIFTIGLGEYFYHGVH